MEENLQLDYDAILYSWVRDKGMELQDVDFAINKLSEVSPFHLENYGLQWIDKRTGRYREGVSFDLIYETYHADRILKNFLFTYLAEEEVQLRNVLSYLIGKEYGAQGYLDPGHFVNPEYHENFINEVKLEVSRTNEPYMLRYVNKDLEEVPIAVALDIVTFGSLAKLYANMKKEDQNKIAAFYRLDLETEDDVGKVLESFFYSMTDLRNICAHHGRLSWRRFKREIIILSGDKAEIDKRDPGFKLDPYGFFACLLAVFHLAEPERKGDLRRDMIQLFQDHPHYEREALQLPVGWEELLASYC